MLKRLSALAVMVLALAALSGGASANPVPRKTCAGFHYKGATVHDIVVRYIRCKMGRALTKAYYDTAAPTKPSGLEGGFRIPGFRGWRGYYGAIGGPIVRNTHHHGIVKIHGPDFLPSKVSSTTPTPGT